MLTVDVNSTVSLQRQAICCPGRAGIVPPARQHVKLLLKVQEVPRPLLTAGGELVCRLRTLLLLLLASAETCECGWGLENTHFNKHRAACLGN